MSVRTRILLGCLALTLVTVVLGVYSREADKRLGGLGLRIYDEAFMAVNYMRSAQYGFAELSGRYRQRQSKGEATDPADLATAVDAVLEDLDVARDRAMSDQGRNAAESLRGELTAFKSLLASNDLTRFEQAIDRIEHSFTVLSERYAADGFRFRRQVEALVAENERNTLLAIGASVVIALIITALLARSILPSIRQTVSVALAIAQGKLDNKIDPRGSSELAQMGRALDTMQKAIADNLARIEALRRTEAEAQAERQRAQEQVNAFTEAALQASRARYALVAQGANDGLWDWELATNAAFFSPRWRAMMDLPPGDEAATIDLWLDRIHPDDLAGLNRRIDAHIAGRTEFFEAEYRVLSADAEERWMLARGACVRDADGAVERVAGSQTDITLRKRYERKLEIAAYEDPLTSIANRLSLLHQLETVEPGDPGAVALMIILNIDRFRQINNIHGSKVADGVLVAVAGMMLALIETPAVCARSAGDEFTLWFPALPATEVEDKVAEVQAIFAAPLRCGDIELAIKVSGGVATASADRVGVALLAEARAALDQAKRQGGDRFQSYDDRLRKDTEARLRIESELGSALSAGQIFLMYQPVVNLARDRIGGFEALARWTHPELGSIPPGRFVPIAEETGAIVDLGKFALQAAADQAAIWMASGKVDPDFTIAVNLSPRQFVDSRNARDILAFLDAQGAAARHLKLEITEGVLLNDPGAMRSLLGAFKERGVTLSLDDFGTGYSSLSYLHQFPFDVLKIDRSFVIDMAESGEALRLVRSIIELGHDLGLEIVAEGVETEPQARLLRELGCDFIQGYLYSRPLEIAAADALIARHHQPGWHGLSIS
jgi:diguanylate cyclase (GGDEF)-like protein/PAS domain S-box-containing protein